MPGGIMLELFRKPAAKRELRNWSGNLSSAMPENLRKTRVDLRNCFRMLGKECRRALWLVRKRLGTSAMKPTGDFSKRRRSNGTSLMLPQFPLKPSNQSDKYWRPQVVSRAAHCLRVDRSGKA